MYGHTVGGNVAMGYIGRDQAVTEEWISEGAYEIEVAGVRYETRASLRPLYDPGMKKIKC
jgi:4-methylaminobutanoate oxidase (formaldehyde-forming)